MTKLLNEIYDTGKIPTGMSKSIFIAIPKKPGARECEMDHTISLMSRITTILHVVDAHIPRLFSSTLCLATPPRRCCCVWRRGHARRASFSLFFHFVVLVVRGMSATLIHSSVGCTCLRLVYSFGVKALVTPDGATAYNLLAAACFCAFCAILNVIKDLLF